MVNKVILIGNLGADPEMRATQSGTQVANLRLATTERWRDQSGQNQESTEWHRVIFFGRQAEICGQYLGKGSRIYVEGKLQTRKWQDQNGNDRYTTEIVGREMKMLSSRNDANSAPAGGYASQQPQSTFSEPTGGDIYAGTGDDVPF